MARVNISMPDDLHTAARRAGLNVSKLAQQAIAGELARIEQRANGDSSAKARELERMSSSSR
ncbi:MAG: type II toxin-antitoxin system CcdA family antitoxin [Acidimicrobiales bacterium]